MVEDQPVVLNFWQYEFSKHKGEFELLVATSAAAARKIVSEQEIDVAIVDMGIPIDPDSPDPKEREEHPRNGLLLLEELKSRHQVKTFALSGTLNPSLQRHIDCPLITKPVKDFEEQVFTLLRTTNPGI